MLNDSLKQDFLLELARFRKLGSALPEACGFQLVELSVMRRVTENCPEGGQCLDVAEIQHSLRISKSGVSQTLSVLERKGYIVRQIDTRDRRRIVVVPTTQGQKELEKATGVYDRLLQQLMDEYGEEDMRSLTAQLARLAEVYERVRRRHGSGE